MDKLDGIRAFVAVVDAGSFTAAGERLRISNKLVSKYVAALEAQQGVTLLNRTTRSLSLTPAGTRYLQAARQVLGAVEALDATAHAEDGVLTGRLRVSAPVTFGEMFCKILTADFLTAHPGLSVDLNLTDRFVDLAAEGFDLALRIGTLADSSLMSRRLGQTATWAVASPAYIARHGRPDTPEALRHHISIRDSNAAQAHRAVFVIKGRPVSVALPGHITVNSAQAVRQLVLAGEGLALIPRFVIAQDVAEGRLVQLLADYPTPPMDIQALHLPQSFQPPRLLAYLDHLKARLRPIIEAEPPPDS